MEYSTNFNMNKPERADQYNLDHWNENTDTIDTELKALQSITDSEFKTALLNFCYPVGSLYWSSNSANPSTLFGGTWVQIKDRFVWAKGDNDTVNATGGAKTVTLEVANLPSHNHTFTGAEHTHSFTPSGTISVKTNPTFTGSSATTNSQSASTTGNQSANPSYSWTGSHSHNFAYGEMLPSSGSSFDYLKFLKSTNSGLVSLSDQLNFKYSNNTYYTSYGTIEKYTISSYQPSTESGNAKYLSGYSTPNYDREYGNGSKLLYNKDTSITVSGTTTGNHTHSYSHTHTLTANGSISGGAYTFSGTAGTTGKATQGGTIGNTGSGTAVDKMPPYIVKYCWERTA